jgi:hypothetical protein
MLGQIENTTRARALVDKRALEEHRTRGEALRFLSNGECVVDHLALRRGHGVEIQSKRLGHEARLRHAEDARGDVKPLPSLVGKAKVDLASGGDTAAGRWHVSIVT